MTGIEVPSWSSTSRHHAHRARLRGDQDILRDPDLQALRRAAAPGRHRPLGRSEVGGVAPAVRTIQQGAYVAALCLAAGLLAPVALVFLTAAIIIEVTFRSSYGAVNHGHHLLAVILTTQTAAMVVWNAAVRGAGTSGWCWPTRSRARPVVDRPGDRRGRLHVRAVEADQHRRPVGRPLAEPAAIGLRAGDTGGMMGPRGQAQARDGVRLAAWFRDRPLLTYCAFAGGLLVGWPRRSGSWGSWRSRPWGSRSSPCTRETGS